MGLDMYVYRYPRYKHYRPEDMDAVENLIEYVSNENAREYSLEEWCGVNSDKLPPEKDIRYLAKFVSVKYWAWDDEHQYPHRMISEQVAYWRKANAIHKWFVNHVQDGIDDCSYHREVTEEDLKKIINICKTILDTVVLEDGKVINGYTWSNGKETPNYQDGKYIVNPKICEKLLPTESGFFFGGTEYDQWYISDIEYTYETLKKVLEETDFEKQMLFYVSSW